jgi:hypothetical protein
MGLIHFKDILNTMKHTKAIYDGGSLVKQLSRMYKALRILVIKYGSNFKEAKWP